MLSQYKNYPRRKLPFDPSDFYTSNKQWVPNCFLTSLCEARLEIKDLRFSIEDM
jgi:hypothetical protein